MECARMFNFCNCKGVRLSSCCCIWRGPVLVVLLFIVGVVMWELGRGRLEGGRSIFGWVGLIVDRGRLEADLLLRSIVFYEIVWFLFEEKGACAPCRNRKSGVT